MTHSCGRGGEGDAISEREDEMHYSAASPSSYMCVRAREGVCVTVFVFV